MEDSVQIRNTDIYFLFRKGQTLQQLGTKYKLTRERVRQVIITILKKEILHKLVKKEVVNNSSLSNYDFMRSEEGKELIRSHVKDLFKVRRTFGDEKNKQKILIILNKAKVQGIIPEKFSSVVKYAEAVDVNMFSLQKLFPDIIKRIKDNGTRGVGGRRWSRYYLRCRVCGTDTIRHRCRGYCRNCWEKSDLFKDIQKSSRLRHLEVRTKQVKQYIKEYIKRPEVKMRMKKIQSELINKKLFGGNREKSMEFYGKKCFKCGLSRKDSIAKSGKDLCVLHKNGLKNDNSIENLIPLCRSCFRRYFWKKSL